MVRDDLNKWRGDNMKVTKEELRKLLLRKRRETEKVLLHREEPKESRHFTKNGEYKKPKLDYEVFLQ